MELYDCQVRLSEDVRWQVEKRSVTAAEIMVLRTIHGKEAIANIRRADAKDPPTDSEVRARLDQEYGQALKRAGMPIDRLFGPEHMPLPKKLDGFIDPEAKARRAPKAAPSADNIVE